MGWNYFDVKTLPSVFDIVWCFFPVEGDDSQPGPKLRPALVRKTQIHKDGVRGAVVVSYGTSKTKWFSRHRIDLIIQNSGEIDRLQLTAATRFDLDRIVRVPWAEEFFHPPPHAEEIVTGHLSDEQIVNFRSKLARRAQLPA